MCLNPGMLSPSHSNPYKFGIEAMVSASLLSEECDKTLLYRLCYICDELMKNESN
jgi:hypothetical protein